LSTNLKLKAVVVAASFGLLAAACGSSKPKAAPATTVKPADTTVKPAGSTAAPTAKPAGGSADDKVDGQGAAAFEAALDAAAKSPLKAAGDPIVVAMPNLEGSPGGSFPEIREGAEAATKMINEKLGGIGAKDGKPGRPIKLEVCSHKIDAGEAVACANKAREAKPALIVVGIDFFTPAMYPVWTGLPVMETVPIFVADFDNPGAISAFGGCVSAFPGAAQYLKENFKADKVAIIYSDNAPGQQCYEDTQDRFYTLLGIEHKGFKDTPGDPAVKDATAQQVIDYLKDAKNGAVYWGIAAADCAEYAKALVKGGFKQQIVMSGSCNDASVLKLAESKNAIFEQQSYIVEQAKDYSPFIQKEIAARAQAITDYGPKAPISAFTRTSFSAMIWAYQIMNDLIAAGKDPTAAGVLAPAFAAAKNYHIVGHPPINCTDNAPQYKSVCKKSLTFAQWDGSTFVKTKDGLDGKYIDLAKLLASAPPRKAAA
jgi:ABC-type branched-subunit amino acid transport system substrate-binding protein